MVKTIATTTAPISMALFLRGLLGFVTFCPKSSLLTHHTSWQTWALNAIRATSTITAITVWMIPLQHAKLTSATAVTLISPIFACLLAYLFFGDKLTKANAFAFIISLLGTLIIIDPLGQDFNPDLLYSVLSALAWSVNLIATKIVTKKQPAANTMCQFNVFLMAITFTCVHEWSMPSVFASVLIIGFSALGNLRQFALLQATRKTAISSLMPLEYSRLLFAAFFAVTIYGESPRLEAFIGGALILIGNLFTTYSIQSKHLKRMVFYGQKHTS